MAGDPDTERRDEVTAQEHEAAAREARIAVSAPHLKAVRRYILRHLAALRALEAPDVATIELLDKLIQEIDEFLSD